MNEADDGACVACFSANDSEFDSSSESSFEGIDMPAEDEGSIILADDYTDSDAPDVNADSFTALASSTTAAADDRSDEGSASEAQSSSMHDLNDLSNNRISELEKLLHSATADDCMLRSQLGEKDKCLRDAQHELTATTKAVQQYQKENSCLDLQLVETRQLLKSKEDLVSTLSLQLHETQQKLQHVEKCAEADKTQANSVVAELSHISKQIQDLEKKCVCDCVHALTEKLAATEAKLGTEKAINRAYTRRNSWLMTQHSRDEELVRKTNTRITEQDGCIKSLEDKLSKQQKANVALEDKYSSLRDRYLRYT